MTLKVTVPNTSSDSLTFGSANTPTAAQVIGIDSGSSNGQLAFNTTASGTSTEAMRITAAQNVGIGTSSPSTRLEVSSSGIPALINSSNNQYVLQLSYLSNTSKAYIGTFSNALIFAPSSATEAARIDSSGNLLVGTTSVLGQITCLHTSAKFGYADHNTDASGASQISFRFMRNNADVGSITTTSSATAYNTSSDYRLKENIQPMTGALAKVQALKPCTYKWKADGSDGEGFIAHELQAVVPDCVTGDKDAVDENGNPVYQGIDTSFLVATLTAAIQEQQAIIEQLTNRITALEAK